MRAGPSTIQHTLTPEAAAVLNHSIAEAGRRNHGQTTPLHVAATLLADPSGFLRTTCIRSHPNSSHPLQCRALELCFSVALERLPTVQNMEPGVVPPISNALMAALKRAQAHQRKGCPEQQQQPMLAVKVELEQLIISILDDPSVSRVMREASFSSPAVKSTIEQSLNSNSIDHPHPRGHPIVNVNLGAFGGIGPTRLLANPSSALASMANRSVYINPKLKQGVTGPSGNLRNDQLKKVLDILTRTKKKNPVLVGESEPEAIVKELIKRINLGELDSESPLSNVSVISIEEHNLDKNQLIGKIKELGDLIECRMKHYAGVIVDLGDLKWLVEQLINFGRSDGIMHQHQQMVSETGRATVVEMRKLLSRFTEFNNACKVWLIGTATCETYLRCQVYHPTLENDWDLQAMPIAAPSPMPIMLPGLGTLSNSIEPLIPLKSFETQMAALNRTLIRKLSGFPENSEKQDQTLNSSAKDIENSFSENKSEVARSSLPQWLQDAKLCLGDVKAADQLQRQDQEIPLKQNAKELQRKQRDSSLNIHNSDQNVAYEKIASRSMSPVSLYNPKLLALQHVLPKSNTIFSLGDTLKLHSNVGYSQPSQRLGTPPGSPLRTDLVLGRKVDGTDSDKIEETCQDTVMDFLAGSDSAEPQMKFVEKFAGALDAASFKKLLKGLMEIAWWQPDAAFRVASAVTRCQSGNGKKRASGAKGDIWLLFTGPDRVGKRKMASVLSKLVRGANPITIPLGSRRDGEELDTNFRGKTAIDRIVEAVRKNPFSVIMLEDIDEAGILLRGSIKRAMERGRLTDSYGREISLGNVIFILTGSWSTYDNSHSVNEKKLTSTGSGNWQLKLTIGEKNLKRRAHWMPDSDRQTKPRKESSCVISFDLNLAADTEHDRTDGSHNSSDLTVDHEEEPVLESREFSITSVPQELVLLADDAVVFKPVDFGFVRQD